MNGLRAPSGRDLHARHEPYTETPCGTLRLLEPRHRVVIGERQHLYAGAGGTLDELRGSQRAIGADRMSMQIERRALVHVGLPASPTASTCPPASTMKPCDRSNPSFV